LSSSLQSVVSNRLKRVQNACAVEFARDLSDRVLWGRGMNILFSRGFSKIAPRRDAGAGHASGEVFRVTAVVALMGHAFGPVPNGIWWGHPWKTVAKHVIDGVVYALIIGAIFAWCWPK
jgi:hypothetical protein